MMILAAGILLTSMPACSPSDKGGEGTPDTGKPDAPASVATPKVGEVIPAWEEGVMDLHFINTTTGESVFVIMPDGTQLLIDAASSTVATNSNANTTNSGIRGRWDPTKTNTRGSQIIADYIKKCMVWTGNDQIDYFVTTHYDNDHIGGYTTSLPFSANSNTYRVIGAAEILDEFKVGKFMDRGYPDYNYPHATKYYKDNVQNYIKAVKWHVANKGLNAEIFKSGSNTQIAPKSDKYDVTVQNISVNGEIWTGVGTNTRHTFPELKDIVAANPPEASNDENCPPENACSCVMKISFGNFDYWAGGDLQYNGKSSFSWKNIELACAQVGGKVDVMKANHHGVTNTNQAEALKAHDPRHIVVCSWVDCHPRTKVLNEMITTLPNVDVHITNFWQGERPSGVDDKVTAEEAARVKLYDGHIVVRVTDGGRFYRIMTLEDVQGTMKVKKVTTKYTSR